MAKMDQMGENSKSNFYGSISAVNSFSSTANSITNAVTSTASIGNDSKYSKMKKVVGIIEMYLKTQAEDLEITINQLLQALSQTTDLSIFDPHTNIASKFFICTYDLMNILDPRRLTNWYCVDVLLNACKNSTTRAEIKKTYHFLPCLARMVSDHITTEKKITLLRLMQELTCGIKIYWHMPHISNLMAMLCKWIGRQEQDSTDVVGLSLGVLVNLCYKNSTSMYILQKNVDLKKFVRMCLALKGPIVEVYVCQVTIILENIPGYVPTMVFSRLIDSTLTAVSEAYKNKDCIVLKQIIEFFMEYVKDHVTHLSGYDKGEKNIKQVLDIIESEESAIDFECLSVLLEFISFLIEKRIPQISCLYNRIIPLAQKWVDNQAVSYQALVILKMIASTTDKADNHVWESISVGLRIYLHMLNSCSESISMTSGNVKRLAALLQLLTASLQIKNLSSKICKELREEMFSSIFSELLADESPKAEVGTCSIESVNFYIYALELVSKLVHHNNKWIGFLQDILGHRQIHVIIAQAICHSPAEVRTVALELCNSCAPGVSAALNNLQSIISIGEIPDPVVSGPLSNDFSMMPLGQYERFTSLLDNMEHSISKNEINNISMSELMELYNYKLSYMTQAENAARLSVDAATKHCTHLQHRIQRLMHEHTRLQQSDLQSIQKLEDINRKKTEMELELRDLQNKFEAEKGRYKALNSQLLQKEAALKESEDKASKLQGLLNKVEETGRRLEKNIQKKDDALKSANETISNYSLQVKELEKLLAEKNRLLEETRTALQLKSNILDSITKMANSQSLG